MKTANQIKEVLQIEKDMNKVVAENTEDSIDIRGTLFHLKEIIQTMNGMAHKESNEKRMCFYMNVALDCENMSKTLNVLAQTIEGDNIAINRQIIELKKDLSK